MKTVLRIFLVVMFFLTAVAGGVFATQTPVCADTSKVNSANYNSKYHLTTGLYRALCQVSGQLLGIGGDGVFNTSFDDDFFAVSNGKYLQAYLSLVSPSADATASKNDLDAGVLNLTTGENASYDCLKTASKITSLSGLENLYFNGISSINFDNNAISSVEKPTFSSMPNLKKISIKDNSLSAFAISTVLDGKIEDLDLSGNNLTQIDLENVSSQAVINLERNLFSSLSAFNFSDNGVLQLNIACNNITNLTKFEEFCLLAHCRPIVFVQGLQKNEFVVGDKIVVENTSPTSNIVAHARYFGGSDTETKSEFYVLDEPDLVSTNSGEGFDGFTIPAGKIEIYFSYTTLPEGISAKAKNVVSVSKLAKVKLPAPKYKLIANQKEIETHTNQDNFYVVFYFDISSEIFANKSDVLNFYNILHEKNLTHGDVSVLISQNGSYALVAKTIFDGLESTSVVANVARNNMTFVVIGILIVLAVVISVYAVIRFRKWLSDGGQIAPLSQKEIASVNRKNKFAGSGLQNKQELVDEQSTDEQLEEDDFDEDEDEYFDDDLS